MFHCAGTHVLPHDASVLLVRVARVLAVVRTVRAHDATVDGPHYPVRFSARRKQKPCFMMLAPSARHGGHCAFVSVDEMICCVPHIMARILYRHGVISAGHPTATFPVQLLWAPAAGTLLVG